MEEIVLQYLWTRRRRRIALRDLYDRARLGCDPLWHPALRAMSAAELADIPFPRPAPDTPEPGRRS